MTTRTLIANARVVDPARGRESEGWLLLDGDTIADLGDGPAPDVDGADVVDAAGRVVCPGLIDLRVNAGEPGAEHKETLATASAAAAAGGVTSVVVTPETKPTIDDPALIDFLMRRARDTAAVRVHPAAALTKGLAGTEIAEIGLLRDAGAVMFSNGPRPLADAGLMRRALLYARGLGALVAVRPEDAALAGRGVAHEGDYAARLGLEGVPVLAERVQIERDAAIAADAGARLLFDQVSSAAGLAALARAKADGAPVSASVSAFHLALNDLDVGDYRTYARLSPPLRAEHDRDALIHALKDGLVDVVVSAHDPQPPEDKRLPFAEATPGGVGLETLLSVLLGLVHDERMSLAEALRPATVAPAELLGLPQGRLAKGAPADVILVDAGAPWVCKSEDLRSLSKNTPFDERRLQGRALKTWVAGRVVFDRAAVGR